MFKNGIGLFKTSGKDDQSMVPATLETHSTVKWYY